MEGKEGGREGEWEGRKEEGRREGEGRRGEGRREESKLPSERIHKTSHG